MISVTGDPGFPSLHCHLTWIVFCLRCFRGADFIDDVFDHFCAVVLMRSHYVRKNADIFEWAVIIFTPAHRDAMFAGNAAVSFKLPGHMK